MALPSRLTLILAAAAALLLAATAPPARADTLYVEAGAPYDGFNDCRDQGDPCGSIVYATNEASAGDVIEVGAGTYDEQLVLTADVTIAGAGADRTTLDAGGRGVAVEVQRGATATVSGLTITGGNGQKGGGGEVKEGASLTLEASHVTGNEAASGAGIYTRGDLTVRRSTISENTASGARSAGGGLYVAGGQLLLTNSTVSGNGAGVVVAEDGSATLRAATLTQNDGAEMAARSGRVLLESALVGDDAAGAACTEGAGGNLGSAGHNLTVTGGGCPSGSTGDQTVAPGDLFSRVLDPSLTGNGGPTPTHLLAAEEANPALDAGAAVGVEDQRGKLRAAHAPGSDAEGKKVADVGAVELQQAAARRAITLGGEAGWRFLSVPLEGVSVGDLAGQNLVQGVPGAFPGYDANLLTGYAGEAFNIPGDVSTGIERGRGFFWYFFNNDKATSQPLPFDLTLSGSAPTDDITVSGLDQDEQWHMLGNPFDETIDLSEALNLNANGFQTTVYVWKPATATYEMISADPDASDDEIDPWQGFWVERSSTGAGATSLTIQESGTVASAAAKKQSAAPRDTLETGRVELQLVATAEGGAEIARDEAIRLYVHPQATAGWDPWDASKPVPLTATRATLAFAGSRPSGDTTRQAQWSLPDSLAQVAEAPMRLRTSGLPDGATLTLAWAERLRHVPASWEVTLIDRTAGVPVDLREQSSYEFARREAAASPSISREDDSGQAVPLARRRSTSSDSSETRADRRARFALRIAPAGAVGTDRAPEPPEAFALAGNAPNPFRQATTIRYELPRAAEVRLAVYDALGRRVRVLVDRKQEAGRKQIRFEAKELPAGVYFYRITAGSFSETRRLVVAR